MDIGEVVSESGVPASTLRYYEKIGLIKSVGRHGLRRVFNAYIVEHLALIGLGRAAGFTLDEIARMFGADGKLALDRGSLMAKAEELDKSITKLIAMRDGLQHAARCSAPNHLECPTFRKIVRAVSVSNRRRASKA